MNTQKNELTPEEQAKKLANQEANELIQEGIRLLKEGLISETSFDLAIALIKEGHKTVRVPVGEKDIEGNQRHISRGK